MNPPAPRPKFLPEPCVGKNLSSAQLRSTGRSWVPMLSCPADFPLELFTTAVEQLVHHPEYNSTLILRAEIIADIDDPESLARVDVSHLDGLVIVRNIQRRLLPRRPGRDAGLDQHCTLYAEIEAQYVNAHPSVLVLTPIVPSGNALPYYHPAVSHLAFRFLPLEKRLSIEVVPLPGISLDLGARLYRTCLALLETLHRYGWGACTQYRKRVLHDCLIAREEYQDLYLLMRERHKHMVGHWHEVTDPLKHVFEDIGIATFLILLWKHTEDESFLEPTHTTSSEKEPWKRWRRPSGGFVDLGCGNGLLTHILISEGYAGQGLDLRARTSWEHYPIATRENLHVTAFDPTKSRAGMSLIPRRSFIIGNHADELTPWMPVVATRADAAGYLSIPCCAWSFDAKFDRARDIPYPLHRETDGFIESFNLGADGSTTSSYAAYRIWLASLSVQCGWVVECETLRIPSTRNWAIVGRRRIADIANEAEARIDQILQYVRQRGVFKTRRPEGRAGDH